MATQKIKKTTKTTKYVNKGDVIIDIMGRKHCKTCGAYVGNKGKKK